MPRKTAKSVPETGQRSKIQTGVKRSPCADCPWRKDAPAGYWDRAHFTDIWKSCQDDGQALMLCHKSKHKEGGPSLICAGYAVVVGYESVGLRIAAYNGNYDPADYSAGGIELHPDFKTMMRAQRIRPPLRNRMTQREP